MDVAIIEVGMGGEYDPTNVIERPYVCGVASLGFDHMRVLGDTLAKIAWHKAGIFKVCTGIGSEDMVFVCAHVHTCVCHIGWMCVVLHYKIHFSFI